MKITTYKVVFGHLICWHWKGKKVIVEDKSKSNQMYAHTQNRRYRIKMYKNKPAALGLLDIV